MLQKCPQMMSGQGRPYYEYRYTFTFVWCPTHGAHRGSTYCIAEGTSEFYLETVVVTRAVVLVELSKPEPKTKRTKRKKFLSSHPEHPLHASVERAVTFASVDENFLVYCFS